MRPPPDAPMAKDVTTATVGSTTTAADAATPAASRRVGFGRGFGRYVLIGAVATAAHYLVLVLCVEAAGWRPWLASGAGAVAGAQVAYAGNRIYTFDHRGAIGASWLKFQLTALAGALQGMAIVAAAVHAGWHYLAAQVAATVAGLVVTYAVNRFWTFR